MFLLDVLAFLVKHTNEKNKGTLSFSQARQAADPVTVSPLWLGFKGNIKQYTRHTFSLIYKNSVFHICFNDKSIFKTSKKPPKLSERTKHQKSAFIFKYVCY